LAALLLVLAMDRVCREYLPYWIAEGRAVRSSERIDSLEPVPLEGINQWIHVRGQNVNNPISSSRVDHRVHSVHSDSSYLPKPVGKYFAVVQSDQRGARPTRRMTESFSDER
jgi:hypothetical protein